MNIVYVSIEDISRSPLSGWVHFWAVAQELKQRGHSVTVVVPRYPTQTTVPDYPFKIIRLFAPAKNAWGLFCFEWSLLFQAVRIIRKVSPHVMLVRGAGPGWLPGLIFLLFRGLGVPVVLECNGIVWQEYAMRGMSRWLVANVACSAWQQALTCNQLIGVTREITEAHRRLAHRNPDCCHVVPNGVHAESFAFDGAQRNVARRKLDLPANAFVAGYVGVFSPWHHVEQMVGAAIQLQQQGIEDVVIVLIGHGPLFDWSVHERDAHALRNLRLTGAVTDREQIRQWMACFDVGLSVYGPSHGSSLKAFEYMAAGIPIIGAGFPQVVDLCREEGAGLALPSGTADEIAEAIRQMRDHQEHWRMVGRRNRQVAQEKYSWSRVAEEVELVLQKAING